MSLIYRILLAYSLKILIKNRLNCKKVGGLIRNKPCNSFGVDPKNTKTDTNNADK